MSTRSGRRRRAGVLWQDNELVFTTALGTQLDAADVRRSLPTISRRAGIGEEWTPRELRHTFVSLLSDNGMAIEEISRLVGPRLRLGAAAEAQYYQQDAEPHPGQAHQ